MKHICLNGHRIDWESSAILAIESDYKKRQFLESFYMHKTDFSFNDKINHLRTVFSVARAKRARRD